MRISIGLFRCRFTAMLHSRASSYSRTTRCATAITTSRASAPHWRKVLLSLLRRLKNVTEQLPQVYDSLASRTVSSVSIAGTANRGTRKEFYEEASCKNVDDGFG